MPDLCSNLSQFQYTLNREHSWSLHLIHETRFVLSQPFTVMIQIRLRHYQSCPERIVTLTIQLKQAEEIQRVGRWLLKRLSYPQRMDKPQPPMHIVRSFKMAVSDHLHLISIIWFACTVKEHSAGFELYTWMQVWLRFTLSSYRPFCLYLCAHSLVPSTCGYGSLRLWHASRSLRPGCPKTLMT